VTIFSYAGQVTFGFGADRAVVPNVDSLVTAFDEELAEATGSAPTGLAGVGST
jgi:hypothetical protein